MSLAAPRPGLRCRPIAHGSREYDEALALRYDVLRRPLGMVYDPERLKLEVNDYHFAAFFEKRLVGTLILTVRSGTELQMRQFAVAADLQRSGIGSGLMGYAERFAFDRGFTRIMMHARESAIPFYEKHGYRKVGGRFFEVTLPHFEMVKELAMSRGERRR